MITQTTILLSALLVSFQLKAENWPAWRGEGGQGICAEKSLPTTWSKKDGIRWRAVLPDKGNST